MRIVDSVADVGNTSLYTDCLYTSRLLLSGSGDFATNGSTNGSRGRPTEDTGISRRDTQAAKEGRNR